MSSRSSELVFLFPSQVFSGHEKMALKILEKAPYKVRVILNEKLVKSFSSKANYFAYNSFFSLVILLMKIRIKNRKMSVVLIAGSPYGFLFEKIMIKLMCICLIDYVPVPELKISQDRFHHKLMPFFNHMLVDKRLLIDHWQGKYSAVNDYRVCKNIV